MLSNRKWQPVEGLEGVRVYPVVNRADFMTSNAFIVEAPEVVVLVDPGNTADQLDHLRSVIGDAVGERPRPVVAFLTHCHVDHCFAFLAAPSAVAPAAPVFVAIQENGWHAVARKDVELTGSGRYRKTVPDPNIDICLLSAEDRKFEVAKELRLAPGLSMKMVTRTVAAPGGGRLCRQEISCGRVQIAVYHTPGHSPDSVSLQIGDLLFIGDFLFSADYFIAGLPGWDKAQIMASAQNLLWLIESGTVATVAQGHGSSLTADRAVEKLNALMSGLAGLQVTQSLNLEKILESSEHAVDVSLEAREIMASITRSLRQTVHYLEYLQESEEASRCAASWDQKRLEGLLAICHETYCDVQSGVLIESGLILKSSSVFHKLRAMLDREGLAGVVNPALLARLERLFDDFIADSGGVDVGQQVECFPAGAFLQALVASLQQDRHADMSILETVDDPQAFAASLAERLAYSPAFREVRFEVGGDGDLLVQSDRSRLGEVLEIVVERLVAEGSDRIAFLLSRQDGWVHLAVDGGRVPQFMVDEGYRKRSLVRRLRWMGGRLGLEISERAARIVLWLPPAGDRPSLS